MKLVFLGKNLPKSLHGTFNHVKSIVNFSLGEKKIVYTDINPGDEVLITQTISLFESASDKAFELLLAIHSLPEGCKITLYLPYLYYSRQDRDSDSALVLFFQLLENLGVIAIITYDIHNESIIESTKIKIENRSIIELLGGDLAILDENSVIISPDFGGAERAKNLAKLTGLEYIVLQKNRYAGAVQHNFTGSLKFKKAIMIDDILDSGKTILSSIEFLKTHGVKEFDVIVSHYLSTEKILFPKEVKSFLTLSSIDHLNSQLPDLTKIIDCGKKVI